MENKWVCYLIANGGYTYVGVSPTPDKRLRQHNGEIKGGAKYTRRSKSWRVLFYLEGFSDSPSGWKETLSCEWHLKHVTKYRRGTSPVARRWRNVRTLLKRPRWSHVRLVDKKIETPKKQTCTMGAVATSVADYAADCGAASLQIESDDEDARSVASALYEEEKKESDFRSIPLEVPPAAASASDPADSSR